MSKFKNLYWLKSGILTMLQHVSVVFFGFGSFYLLVRELGKSEFGVWVLFMSTTSVLEVIRNGLIQNGFVKFLSGEEKMNHSQIISASFSISALLTGVCVLFNFAFAGLLSQLWDSPKLVPMFYTYNIVFVLTGILSQLQFIEQANLRFTGIFLSTFARQGTFFAFILSSFIFNSEINMLTLVHVQILGALLGVIVISIYAWKNLAFSYKQHKSWIRKLFNYGKFAFGTSVSSMVFNSIDQWMLGSLVSTSAAGAYNIAIRITNLVEIPTSSVASIVFPQSAKRVEKDGKKAVKYLYEKSVGTILALLVPGLLFIFLFPEFVVHFIAGESYSETIDILKVTILYCLIIPYGRQFGTILDSMGKPKLTFSIVLLCAVINVGVNYLFINLFGVIGAAYGTLTANIIGFFINQSILRKQLGVSMFNTLIYAKNFYIEFFKKYLKPSLVS